MTESLLEIMDPPPIRSILTLVPGITVHRSEPPPNAWWRWWQYVLLGWRWKKP